MEHEYDELVEDEYSSKGHYDLLVRQGALIGLTADALELFKLYHLGVAEAMEKLD
jgi:hypothetical protein